MVPMPKLLYDKKYKEWVIFDDPYEPFVLKPNAPKELQEALAAFERAAERDNLIVSSEELEKWIEKD